MVRHQVLILACAGSNPASPEFVLKQPRLYAEAYEVMKDIDKNKKHAIILAAGKGTRMKSDLPKVLAQIEGKPLIIHVLERARAAGINDLVLVVGYARSYRPCAEFRLLYRPNVCSTQRYDPCTGG